MRSLPAWEARLAPPEPPPREERANSGTAGSRTASASWTCPTLFLLGGDSAEPFRLASEAVAGGCRTARWS